MLRDIHPVEDAALPADKAVREGQAAGGAATEGDAGGGGVGVGRGGVGGDGCPSAEGGAALDGVEQVGGTGTDGNGDRRLRPGRIAGEGEWVAAFRCGGAEFCWFV